MLKHRLTIVLLVFTLTVSGCKLDDDTPKTEKATAAHMQHGQKTHAHGRGEQAQAADDTADNTEPTLQATTPQEESGFFRGVPRWFARFFGISKNSNDTITKPQKTPALPGQAGAQMPDLSMPSQTSSTADDVQVPGMAGPNAMAQNNSGAIGVSAAAGPVASPGASGQGGGLLNSFVSGVTSFFGGGSSSTSTSGTTNTNSNFNTNTSTGSASGFNTGSNPVVDSVPGGVSSQDSGNTGSGSSGFGSFFSNVASQVGGLFGGNTAALSPSSSASSGTLSSNGTTAGGWGVSSGQTPPSSGSAAPNNAAQSNGSSFGGLFSSIGNSVGSLFGGSTSTNTNTASSTDTSSSPGFFTGIAQTFGLGGSSSPSTSTASGSSGGITDTLAGWYNSAVNAVTGSSTSNSTGGVSNTSAASGFVDANSGSFAQGVPAYVPPAELPTATSVPGVPTYSPPGMAQAATPAATSGAMVSLKCGTVYRGPLNVAGQSNITIKTEGGCGKAVITPGKPLSGWRNYRPSIYVTSAPFTVASVTFNGQPMERAHYPNRPTIWLYAPDSSANSINTEEEFPSTDLAGATVRFRNTDYLISERIISSNSAPTLTLQSGGRDDAKPNGKNLPFYLEGKLWMLDQPGEWVQENGLLYVWLPDGSAPDARVEAAPAVDAINASKSSNITVDGVKVVGGENGINGKESTNLKILNTEVLASNADGVQAENSVGLYVDNSDIVNTNYTSINGGTINRATVVNSRIVNSGGSATMPRGSWAAIYFGEGSTHRVENTTVKNAPNAGIRVRQNASVRNNTVDSVCLILNDCGGIYIFARDRKPTNTQITGNRLTNIGGYGIYLDDSANGVSVTNNTVTGAFTGLLIHDGFNNSVTGNTFQSSREQHAFIAENYQPRGSVHDNVVTNNTFITTNNEKTFNLSARDPTSDLRKFGTFTPNTYTNTSGMFAALEVYGDIDYSNWLKFLGGNDKLTIADDGYIYATGPSSGMGDPIGVSGQVACTAANTASPSPAPQPVSNPPSAVSGAPYGQNANDWVQTFAEEFNSWNPALWNDTIWYESSNPTRNFTVENGMLKIWPQRDASGNFFNRTIDTDGKYYQTYGYFEMEAKLPRGKGTWPAFWLFAHPGDRRPEMDIMEAYAGGDGWGYADSAGISHPTAYGATVWIGDYADHEAGFKMYDGGGDLSAGFHKYAVKWEPNKQTYYFDGREVLTVNVSMNDPMYLMLDLWFGSYSGQPDGSTPQGKDNAYEINYVRAWKLNDGVQAQVVGSSGSSSAAITPATYTSNPCASTGSGGYASSGGWSGSGGGGGGTSPLPAAAAAVATPNKGPFGQDPSAWEPTLSEEFNTLNTGLWNDHSWYQQPVPTKNYTVENGVFKVWPQRTPEGTFFNREINTDGRFYQTYGYFEIEAKLPVGRGVWPAFWLYNHDQPDPYRPEIDIMEAYPGGGPSSWWSNADLHPTAYGPTIWTGAPGAQAGWKMIDPGLDLSANFHKYALKWEPGKQTFYFDGKPVYSVNVSMSDRMYIILDLWFGSASGKPDSTTPTGKGNAFEVNYLRVWKARGAAGPTGSYAATAVSNAVATVTSGAVGVGYGSSTSGSYSGTGTSGGTTAGTPTGQTGGTPSTPSTSTGSTYTSQAATVEYYGDSLIWGWDGSRQDGPDGWPRVANPAPSVFASMLPNLRVTNMGYPGRLSEDALNGKPPIEEWTSLMAKSPANYVILEYHSHDSASATTSRLRQLIQIAKQAGKKVIVETIGPGNHEGNLEYHQITDAQKAAAAAEGVPVIDQTAYLDGYMAQTGKSLYNLCPDSLHPIQEIYTLKGRYAASVWSSVAR